MKIVLNKNNKTLLHSIFMLWLLGEMLLQNTMFSRVMLMAFVGTSILFAHRFCWSAQLTGYALFALWSVLNIFMGHAVSNSTAQAMTQTLFLNLLFLYALVCYCRYTGSAIQIMRIYKWVALLFCILLLAGGIGEAFLGQRLSIFEVNSNRIAKFLSYAVIVALFEQLYMPKEKRYRWRWLVIAFLLVTILLTGSRKGLIIPVIGFYVLFCIRKPGKVVKYSAIAVAATLALLTMILNIKPLYEIIGYRVEAVLLYLQEEEFAEGSLYSRMNFIDLGWRLSKNSPVWGHGLDCFRLLRYAYDTYSHCNYIEILYSLGWVGVVLYYSPFVYCIVSMFKYRSVSRELVSIMAALLIPFIVCDYFNVTYFDRLSLLIPAMAMITLSKRGMQHEVTASN